MDSVKVIIKFIIYIYSKQIKIRTYKIYLLKQYIIDTVSAK